MIKLSRKFKIPSKKDAQRQAENKWKVMLQFLQLSQKMTKQKVTKKWKKFIESEKRKFIKKEIKRLLSPLVPKEIEFNGHIYVLKKSIKSTSSLSNYSMRTDGDNMTQTERDIYAAQQRDWHGAGPGGMT